ncbi:helix-turn-helix domain-containing protein [Nonomuraea sp. H19]|uniref:helix-turn-helix domain-containing protein n=1 Tax=Nonomuraea sp. H19 TaxID=3452206 RepID=UPI003F89D074
MSAGRWRRITELIWELFRVSYTLSGVDYLLHRLGWSWQVPMRPRMARSDGALAASTHRPCLSCAASLPHRSCQHFRKCSQRSSRTSSVLQFVVG